MTSFRLFVEHQGRASRTETFSAERILIGRDEGDLVLPDALISTAHAELRFDGQRVWLLDLQSTNGTWLNGQRISQLELVPGMSVQLGQHRVTFTGLVGAAGGRGGTVAQAAHPMVPPGMQPMPMVPSTQQSSGAWPRGDPGSSQGRPKKSRVPVIVVALAVVLVGIGGFAVAAYLWRARLAAAFTSAAARVALESKPAPGDGVTLPSTHAASVPTAAPDEEKTAAPRGTRGTAAAASETETGTATTAAATTAAVPAAEAPASTSALATLFDGAPSGYELTRWVPLNRTLPKKLVIWAPPGWDTSDEERLDDVLQIVSPDSQAIVLFVTNSWKVNDAVRKVWTQSLDVRRQSYGPWEAGRFGEAHLSARVSEGTGTLENEPAKLYAIVFTAGSAEFLVVVVLTPSASKEVAAQALAVAKSARQG